MRACMAKKARPSSQVVRVEDLEVAPQQAEARETKFGEMVTCAILFLSRMLLYLL